MTEMVEITFATPEPNATCNGGLVGECGEPAIFELFFDPPEPERRWMCSRHFGVLQAVTAHRNN